MSLRVIAWQGLAFALGKNRSRVAAQRAYQHCFSSIVGDPTARLLFQRGLTSCGLDFQSKPGLRFSTKSSSSSFSPLTWWQNRQEQKRGDKFKKQIEEMANKESWTMGDMRKELDEAVKSWTAKIPYLSNNKDTNMAKDMHKTISAIIQVVGEDATLDTLDGMTHIEKLKAAAAAGCTVDDVNSFKMQFESMDLMHRVVRKRKLEGKVIPQTAEAMETVIQAEGVMLMSKAQRKEMARNHQNEFKKTMGRR